MSCSRPPCSTAAARSATSAPAPSTRRRSPGSPSPASSPSSASPSSRRDSVALRDRLVDGVRREVPDAHLQRRPGDGLDHRLPGNAHLELPGLRGRLAADAARRARHRVLDRIGVLRRRAAGLARAARHGLLGGVRAVARCGSRSGHTSHRGRRRRARRGDRAGRRARPHAAAVHQGLREIADARPGSDVRRRRLGGGGRACGRAGHDVTGIHLALSRNPKSYRTGARGCCTIEDANDARRAADVIGIPFYVWDLSERFHEDVVEDFLSEYAEGRTPNPCLRCNEKIKFAAVLDRAIALGFDAVVTGHYAQLRRDEDGADRDAPRGGPRQGPELRARRTHPGAARALDVPARRQSQVRGARGGGAARSRRRRQARQPRHLLHQRRRHRRVALREAVGGNRGGRDRRPPTARCSARTRGRCATRSASAAACASGRRPRTGSRATCSTSSRSPAPSPSGRVRARRRRPRPRSSRAGAVPRRSATLECTVQLRAHGDEHRAVVRVATTASSRPARPRRGDRARPGGRRVRRLAGRRLRTIAATRRAVAHAHDDRATGVGSMPGEDFGEAAAPGARRAARPAAPARAPGPRCDRRHDRSHARSSSASSASTCSRPAGGSPTRPGSTTAGRGRCSRRTSTLLEEQTQGYEGDAQGAGHRPVDAGEHGREAARRPGPLRRRRASRARAGAGRGAGRAPGRRAAPGARRRLLLQLDEPALPAVLAGQVPTASGFNRHRSVDAPARLRGAGVGVRRGRRDRRPWRTAARPSRRSGCCAARVPGESRSTSTCSPRVRTTSWRPRSTKERGVLLGVVPSTGEAAPATEVRRRAGAAAARHARLRPGEVADQLVLTPACGLAGATPSYARAALRAVQEAAAELG